ncbi:MAG: aminopeptidase, partial [Lentisphaeria bacterium]|nr:aminopeptidase [Lentisphaeria bacterium]
MDKKRLDAYADLLVKKGLNLDRGQEVLIIANLDQPEFVRTVTEKCYEAGASRVSVDWHDMPVEKLHQLHQSEAMLSEVEPWVLSRWQWRAEKLPAMIWLDSDDPDGMNGIDQAKRAKAQMARFPVIKPYREAAENRHQWCIAGVPGVEWARKVFPGIPDPEAVEKL